MKADLHMHSVYSDGTYEVKDLVLYAKKKGLDIIALSDHDSVEGVSEALLASKEVGIKVIPAMELSTVNNGESVHVLGYFPNGIPEKIMEYSKNQYEHRRKRAYQMAMNMIELHGLKMNIDRLMSAKGMITRSHLIKEVVLSNPEYTSKEVFDKFLNDDAPGYIPSTHMTTKEGIQLLTANKAFIVIAHPTLLKHNNIEDLITEDVDGIEGIYPKNKENDEAFFREICKKHHIVITAGSDFHGVVDYSHRDMAYNVLEGDDLAIFLKKLGEKNENHKC